MKLGLTRQERRRLRIGVLFALPWIVGFLSFTIFPVAYSFYYSLNVFTTFGQPLHWVGLSNYVKLINDDLFWVSLYNTMYMVVFGVSFHIVLAIILGLLLNQNLRGVSIYRTVYYIPTIVPIVATSVLWMWVFNPEFGLINSALSVIDVHGPGWLTDPVLSKPSLILMGVWTIGGTLVIFLAGLQDIPQHLFDAAMIDGAGALQRIRNVTLPMLSPVIFFNVIIGVIAGFQIFAQAFIMTRGGPLDTTLFYAYYLYQNAFEFFQMPYASAMAWILFLVVMGTTLIIFRSSARLVYYEGEER
ncbi:MAG: sugar ABC transporter permease [Caldilineaceae bacterium]|nr:sugar ABC transporter permease [Caldilineaceae bacterium]